MGRRIYLTEEDLSNIKYLYSTTTMTIQNIADKYNVGWEYIHKILKSSNIIKPKDLQFKMYSDINKNIWKDKSKEQRSQIAKNRWSNISEEDKKLRYEKVSKSSKHTWSNKSEKEKHRLSNIRSLNAKQIWQNKSKEERQNFIDKQKALWTDSKRLELGQKISKSYNSKTEQEKQKLRNITSKCSKQMWNQMSYETRLKRSDKLKTSISNVWKNRDINKKKEIYSKIYQTLTKHNTFSTSQMEYNLNELLKQKYTNLKWQCRLSTFWFDFKVNNTYIELNGKYWHYKYPYTDTIENENIYNNLINSEYGQFKAIAKKWKYFDVNKLNYCKQNNLNYIVIYYDKLNQLDSIYKYIENNLDDGIHIYIL